MGAFTEQLDIALSISQFSAKCEFLMHSCRFYSPINMIHGFVLSKICYQYFCIIRSADSDGAMKANNVIS